MDGLARRQDSASLGSNGRKYAPIDDGSRYLRAEAIKGNEIIAIADCVTVVKHRGPGTRVIDAEGGSVLPGFIEAHMHLFRRRAELDNLHLQGVHGFDALRDAIRSNASARPNAKLLLGAGVD